MNRRTELSKADGTAYFSQIKELSRVKLDGVSRRDISLVAWEVLMRQRGRS